ncbi:MAG: hypothetical protein AAFQ39_05705 [Pseudomonadota bacterium]
MFARTAALTLTLALPANAQDTAGAWAPTFTSRHGDWDVTCDARGDGAAREERCYMRYIDIYAPQPNFGVLFMFLEIEDAAPVISLGREFETDLVATALRVSPGWTRSEVLCTGGPCEIAGPQALAMVEALSAGGMLEIGFTDATGADQLRQWPAGAFGAAFVDVVREAKARGL